MTQGYSGITRGCRNATKGTAQVEKTGENQGGSEQYAENGLRNNSEKVTETEGGQRKQETGENRLSRAVSAQTAPVGKGGT